MARAKQLRPVDVLTQQLLAEAVAQAGVVQMTLQERTGISQNRISIILRGATPPATVGEVCAIAHAVGENGAAIIGKAEEAVGSDELVAAAIPDEVKTTTRPAQLADMPQRRRRGLGRGMGELIGGVSTEELAAHQPGYTPDDELAETTGWRADLGEESQENSDEEWD